MTMYPFKTLSLTLFALTSLGLGEIPSPINQSTVDSPPMIVATAAEAKAWTDSAKYLAGITVEDDSRLADLQSASYWQTHQQFLDQAWSQLETQQLAKVRNWSDQELASINESEPTIFYPFSGPDFLYAYSFFPQAKEYVLIGLEPIGWIPNFSEMSPGAREQKLSEFRSSLQAILQWSFFRTNDMKVDMAQQGVLPYIFLFMARTNNQILDVEYVGVDNTGNIVAYNEDLVPGVKILFQPPGESETKTLYYFSTDLSDGGLNGNPQFIQFIKSLDTPVTYLKAASYLMYYDYFSSIRNLILEESKAILQDDSGMPVRFLNNGDWELQFYGTYTAPIPLFKNMYQADLRQIYQSNQNIKPLDFGVGYKFGINESNLMLARRVQQ